MKTLKRLAALVLVGAMALSLAACGTSKKKVTAKEFKKIMKAADFDVAESEDEDDETVKQVWEATYTDGDSGVYIPREMPRQVSPHPIRISRQKQTTSSSTVTSRRSPGISQQTVSSMRTPRSWAATWPVIGTSHVS